MQIENKCQNVMSSQGLELSSLHQLSLGLRFLKSCHFGRTLVLSPQIHHFSLQNRMKKAHSWFLVFVFIIFIFELFSSFYLVSKGQGTSITWINRLAAGDSKLAAPPDACLTACCIAGKCNADTGCCSHILGIIYINLWDATVHLD